MPYVRQPEDLIPGRPLFFATATTLNGVANGVLVGEPRRPPHQDRRQPRASGLARRVRRLFAGRVLQLYDPDRSQALTLNGEIRSWGVFIGSAARCSGAAEGQERRRHPHSDRDHHFAHAWRRSCAPSSSCIRQSKWHQWEPAGPHSARAGAMQAFGQPVNTYYDFIERQCRGFAGLRFPGSGPAQPALRAPVRAGAAAWASTTTR